MHSDCMGIYKLVFLDELHIKPIKEYTLECDFNKGEIEDIVALLNATKWRSIVDLNTAKKNLRGLKRCDLLKEKKIVLGGFSGGPIGMREYSFPVIYENPTKKEYLEIDAEVECKQEGSHLICSLNPEVL